MSSKTKDPEKQKQNAEQRRINLQKKFERRALKQGKKTGTKSPAISSKSMLDQSQPASNIHSELQASEHNELGFSFPGPSKDFLPKPSKSMLHRSQPAPGAASEPHQMIRPEDLTEEEKCNYPLWKKYLEKYPLIHTMERQPDLFEQKSCTVALVHFYQSDDRDKEEEEAEKQFNDFFKDIGFDQEDNTDVMTGPDFYGISRTQYYDNEPSMMARPI